MLIVTVHNKNRNLFLEKHNWVDYC